MTRFLTGDEAELSLWDGLNLTSFWFDPHGRGRLHIDGYFGEPNEIEAVHGSSYGLPDVRRIYEFLGALIAQQGDRS